MDANTIHRLIFIALGAWAVFGTALLAEPLGALIMWIRKRMNR